MPRCAGQVCGISQQPREQHRNATAGQVRGKEVIKVYVMERDSRRRDQDG